MATKQARPHTAKPVVKRKHVRTRPLEAPRNTLFPGRDNYTGPNTGYFAMLHHTQLFESTESFSDGVRERIRYVRGNKPRKEINVRLSNMMYIGGCSAIGLLEKLERVKKASGERHPAAGSILSDATTRLTWDQRSVLSSAISEYKTLIVPRVLAYIAEHNPKHAWKVIKGASSPGVGVIRGTENTF